jgi:DnaJ-class molecular chaperone
VNEPDCAICGKPIYQNQRRQHHPRGHAALAHEKCIPLDACWECGGKGKVPDWHQPYAGPPRMKDCWRCKGSGKIRGG